MLCCWCLVFALPVDKTKQTFQKKKPGVKQKTHPLPDGFTQHMSILVLPAQGLIIQNSFPKSEQKHWRQWRDIQLCCIFRPDNQWKRSSSGIVSADWSYREKTITCTLIKKPTSVAGQNAIIHISPTPLVSGIVWQRGKLQPVNINLSGNFNKIIWEN